MKDTVPESAPEKPKGRLARFFAWVPRWQEFASFLPIVFAIAIVLWILFGNAQNSPTILTMLELPVRCAYALAACGLTYLLWRRWSYRLCKEQLDDYWKRLMTGERGALIVYSINAAFYLFATAMFLWFIKG